MKTTIKVVSAALLLAAGFAACKKIETGFLSDTIRYKNNIIYAKRGMSLTLSDRINADGSTPPFQFELMNLRNADGSPAPAEFTTPYEVQVFKPGMTFDAATDTTVELLNAKREVINQAPMIFNPVSGQLAFNRASANLPLGQYTFDLKVTNPWGTKTYPSFAQIHVIEPSIEDVFSVTTTQSNGSSAAEVFTAMKAPVLTCTKIANEGARVILKIVDKNGNPFNPKNGEVIRRGDRPTFESHAKFNPVLATDTALICDYEVAPFPLARYITPATDWGYLIYYRIPAQFASIDNLPNNAVNPAFAFRVLMEGTYVVEVKLTDVIRRQ